MDLRQSKEFSQYMRFSGWQVEKMANCFIYIRKLPLLPPLIMKAQYPNPPIPFEKIEKLEKKKLQIIEILDLEKLRQAWRKSVGWRRYIPSLKNLKNLKRAFTRKALFLTAQSQGKISGGTILLTNNSRAYYYYAFTSKEGRKKLAQYLLVWEAMKLAKKRGCQIFDFEGIYDKRFPVKDWQGFSHLKKSFGGQEIEYPGVFIKTSF